MKLTHESHSDDKFSDVLLNDLELRYVDPILPLILQHTYTILKLRH